MSSPAERTIVDTNLLSKMRQLLCEVALENTVGKLPGEQMNALLHFFVEWARDIKSKNPAAQQIAAGLTLAFCLGHEWVGRHWLLWTPNTSSQSKELKPYSPGPVAKAGKVTNVSVDLGPRAVVVDKEFLGTSENFTIEVAVATTEELEMLKAASEIRLVKTDV